AYRNDDLPSAARLALERRGPDGRRPGNSVGVADRDGAAIDIVPLGIDAEPVAAVESLHGKGLVELPETDVLDLEPMLLQQLWHRKNRPDPHLVRRAAGNCDTAIGAERLQPAAFGLLCLHQQRGGRAVGQLGGVSRRDEAALFDGLPIAEYRFQRGQSRERRRWPVAFVLVERHRYVRDLASL